MIIERLREISDELNRTCAAYSKELRVLPKGKLLCSKNKSGAHYYVGERNRSGYHRKGISKDEGKITALARKEYLSRALPLLEHNLKLVDSAISKYKPCEPQDIIEKLVVAYKNLPETAFLSPTIDSECIALDSTVQERILSHASWGKQPYDNGDYLPEGRSIVTSRGERMRSKAEVMIAEKLYEYGIPFRYEQMIRLDDGVSINPDFTFEGRGGKEFYLEFCGMMNDEGYVMRTMHKIRRYAESGVVPWKNIIYLFASGNEMNMMRVKAMIDTQIIPWL